MKMSIRLATMADAAALSRLGATTFRETFESENTADDMARYLADAFTPERQAAEIADAANVMLLAEHSAESSEAELVGFAQLVDGPVPDAVSGPAALELKRLYVVPSVARTPSSASADGRGYRGRTRQRREDALARGMGTESASRGVLRKIRIRPRRRTYLYAWV